MRPNFRAITRSTHHFTRPPRLTSNTSAQPPPIEASSVASCSRWYSCTRCCRPPNNDPPIADRSRATSSSKRPISRSYSTYEEALERDKNDASRLPLPPPLPYSPDSVPFKRHLDVLQLSLSMDPETSWNTYQGFHESLLPSIPNDLFTCLIEHQLTLGIKGYPRVETLLVFAQKCGLELEQLGMDLVDRCLGVALEFALRQTQGQRYRQALLSDLWTTALRLRNGHLERVPLEARSAWLQYQLKLARSPGGANLRTERTRNAIAEAKRFVDLELAHGVEVVITDILGLDGVVFSVEEWDERVELLGKLLAQGIEIPKSSVRSILGRARQGYVDAEVQSPTIHLWILVKDMGDRLEGPQAEEAGKVLVKTANWIRHRRKKDMEAGNLDHVAEKAKKAMSDPNPAVTPSVRLVMRVLRKIRLEKPPNVRKAEGAGGKRPERIIGDSRQPGPSQWRIEARWFRARRRREMDQGRDGRLLPRTRRQDFYRYLGKRPPGRRSSPILSQRMKTPRTLRRRGADTSGPRAALTVRPPNSPESVSAPQPPSVADAEPVPIASPRNTDRTSQVIRHRSRRNETDPHRALDIALSIFERLSSRPTADVHAIVGAITGKLLRLLRESKNLSPPQPQMSFAPAIVRFGNAILAADLLNHIDDHLTHLLFNICCVCASSPPVYDLARKIYTHARALEDPYKWEMTFGHTLRWRTLFRASLEKKPLPHFSFASRLYADRYVDGGVIDRADVLHFILKIGGSANASKYILLERYIKDFIHDDPAVRDGFVIALVDGLTLRKRGRDAWYAFHLSLRILGDRPVPESVYRTVIYTLSNTGRHLDWRRAVAVLDYVDPAHPHLLRYYEMAFEGIFNGRLASKSQPQIMQQEALTTLYGHATSKGLKPSPLMVGTMVLVMSEEGSTVKYAARILHTMIDHNFAVPYKLGEQVLRSLVRDGRAAEARMLESKLHAMWERQDGEMMPRDLMPVRIMELRWAEEKAERARRERAEEKRRGQGVAGALRGVMTRLGREEAVEDESDLAGAEEKAAADELDAEDDVFEASAELGMSGSVMGRDEPSSPGTFVRTARSATLAPRAEAPGKLLSPMAGDSPKRGFGLKEERASYRSEIFREIKQSNFAARAQGSEAARALKKQSKREDKAEQKKVNREEGTSPDEREKM